MKKSDSLKSQNWIPTSQTAADGTIQIRLTDIPSLNQFYASKHWSIRKKHKDTFALLILEQLQHYPKQTWEQMEVKVTSNLRLDLDNQIMAVKFALDSFKAWGGIPDDSPKYVKAMHITNDPTITKGEIIITFIKV